MWPQRTQHSAQQRRLVDQFANRAEALGGTREQRHTLDSGRQRILERGDEVVGDARIDGLAHMYVPPLADSGSGVGLHDRQRSALIIGSMEGEQILRAAWAQMERFMARLAAKPETEAVVVLSSAAGAANRLPFDTYSDFDIGLVLDVPLSPAEWRPQPFDTYRLVRERLPAWLPNFSFHVPVPWGRLEVNVNQVIYAYEEDRRTVWDDAKCEAYAETGKVVFDRSGRFAQLVQRKAGERRASRPARLLRIANRLEWDIGVLPRRQAERGELAAAHYMAGRALDELVEACFVLAGRFVPNQKWRFFVLREQKLLPEEAIECLESALHCDPASRDDLERRIEKLSEAWLALREREEGVPAHPYRSFAAAQAQLVKATFADEMREQFGERAYDAANFLLADSAQSLAAESVALPPEWGKEITGPGFT